MARFNFGYYEAHCLRAIGATRLALGRGSVNRWDERDSLLSPSSFVAKTLLHIGSRIASWNADFTTIAGIHQMAINARTAQAGNCGEHAAVCLIELLAQGVRPVHFASFSDASHAFVVAGLELSTIPKSHWIDDPANWNPEAVIADAWADKVGRPTVLFPGKKIVVYLTV